MSPFGIDPKDRTKRSTQLREAGASLVSVLDVGRRMNEGISVHDNLLLGYEVNSEGRIVFHTEYSPSETKEKTDIVFEGVLAYHFEGDLFTSIIFEIEETKLEYVLDQHVGLLERREKHGWPQGWERTKETLEEYLTRKGLKVFGVQSSYGLDGFVIAKSMRKQDANKSAQAIS